MTFNLSDCIAVDVECSYQLRKQSISMISVKGPHDADSASIVNRDSALITAEIFLSGIVCHWHSSNTGSL